MVFCTYCGNSFTRDEHLERHILTHTNVKPFKCFTCHMSFARRDLLQRHYTVHGRNQNQNEDAANGTLPKTAGRTPIACTNCAKTKTKCDKKFPCSRCTARNLRCTIRPTRRSTKNAERLGLITAETIAQSMANGVLPPDLSVAAEQIALPISALNTSPKMTEDHVLGHSAGHDSSGSCCSSQTPPSSVSSQRVRSIDSVVPALDQSHACCTPPEPYSGTPTTPILADGDTLSLSLDKLDNITAPDSHIEASDTQFILDWQNCNGLTSSSKTDLFTDHNMAFGISHCSFEQSIDPMFTISSDVAYPNMAETLLTPLDTPAFERTISDADVATLTRHHSRNQSLLSNHTLDTMNHLMINDQVQLVDPVLMAQDGWNVFRCVPNVHSNACPLTARWNLEMLENGLRNHSVWNTWTPDGEVSPIERDSQLDVMRLHSSTRDKLLAITQSFLHRAMEIHRVDTVNGDCRPLAPSNFLLLPPTKVLEFFLRSYVDSFETLYPVTSCGALDANELIHCHHEKASSLLILLMLAQGASNTCSAEARSLTPGLVETCRISLFDLIERNNHMASDAYVLRTALLFTNLAAWSGDKWQMDIAMGQRGIYIAMLHHSHMLERQAPLQSFFADAQPNNESLWALWVQQEIQSRLVYSWVMLDQELALFHDTSALISVTELNVALPHREALWKARSANAWSQVIDELKDSIHTSDTTPLTQPLGLRDLFQRFLDDDMRSLGYPLTALHLRLLLHPLQSMICHYTQLMSCFSESDSTRGAKSKTLNSTSTRSRVEEVQCLLQRWYSLADAYMKAKPACTVMQASLAMYHIISLNAVTNFKHVEQLARRESFDGTYKSLVRAHKRCISDVGEALFHCGQVLRVVRGMSRQTRPAWWAAAIYRAALVLWCDSLINKDDAASYGSKGPQTLAIDALSPEHPSLTRFLNDGEGLPCLSKRDGSTVSMDHGVSVLSHCVELIRSGSPARLQEGISTRLERLMQS